MEEEKKYCIYMHTNKINNKKYIGQTCQQSEVRWGKNGKNYLHLNKQGEYVFRHFGPAIKKYGWDNFEHIILDKNLTKEEADAMEIKYIDEYQTRDNKYGYNCKEGGANGRPSEESKKRMSESHIGKLTGEEHPKSQSVICLETKITYNSMSEAERILNLGHGTISSCIKGNQKTLQGQHWLTLDSYNSMSQEEIEQYILDRPTPQNNLIEKTKRKQYNNKSVINIISGEVLESIEEAHNVYGDSEYYIAQCCIKGITHVAKNYWAYSPLSLAEIETLKNIISEIEYKEKIILLESKTIYKNAKEAALANNLDANCILHCCKGHAPTYNRKHWMYLQEYNSLSTEEENKLQQKIIRYHSLILCKETGKTYKKFTDAEKDTGVYAWNISRVCENTPGRLTAGGMHWTFISEEEEK